MLKLSEGQVDTMIHGVPYLTDDQLVTRELGFNFFHHRSDYVQFEPPKT